MAEKPTKKNELADLSALEGLTLGTAWTSAGSKSNSPRSNDRPQRRGRPDASRRFKPNNRREAPAPIIPPSLKVIFYPEEVPFKAMVKAIKASMRTYELFEICQLILEKPDRHIAVISQKPAKEGEPVAPLYQAVGSSCFFLTEAEALTHATKANLDNFFNCEMVECEAPKGNFPVVHRCGITGQLIAAPNYHLYNQLLTNHQANNLPETSIEEIQAKIESIKDQEVIKQWLESMSKQPRYTQKEVAEGQTPLTFDSVEAARNYLAQNNKSALIKIHSQVRISGKDVEKLPEGEIRRSIEAACALQQRFPLETANNIRGRLRRVGFALYKKGPKGVSYICATKRNFRTPGQTFVPDIQQVIDFIESHPNIQDSQLPKQMLGINATLSPPKHNPLSETEEGSANEPQAESSLTPEEQEALKKLRQTLHWLTEEGYVTHFGNGKLFVASAREMPKPKTEAKPEAKEKPEAEAKDQAETKATGEEQSPEKTEAKTQEAKVEIPEQTKAEEETTQEKPEAEEDDSKKPQAASEVEAKVEETSEKTETEEKPETKE